jgi:hypothetical protein
MGNKKRDGPFRGPSLATLVRMLEMLRL